MGIAAIFSDELISFGGATLTANIVTMAVFGAIVMYIMSMAALFRLRRTHADLPRSFMAPCFPYFPAFALGSAVICLITMTYYNPLLACLFAGILLVGYLGFVRLGQPHLATGEAAMETP